MRKILPALFLLTFLPGICLTYASEPAATDSLSLLAGQIRRLEERSATWGKIVEKLPRISGFAQLGYEWSEGTSTFFIKRIRLSLAGNIWTEKLDYRIQLEFMSPKVVDAYLRYRPFNALNFMVGEYKIPFLIENTDYVPLKVEFIEEPIALRKLMGFDDMCGLSTSGGRDIGATMYGGFFKREGYSILNYDVGVFNGEGLNMKDHNRTKDVVGRLTIKPVPGLQLSGSYYWGEYGKDYVKRIRYGAGACYDYGRFMLRGEYIAGVTGMPEGAPDLKSGGWFVAGGLWATKTLQPVVRYDTFRENVDRSSTRQTNYTAGLTWQPVKFLRCQLNYTYEDYASAEVGNRNVVVAMFSAIF